MSTIARAVVPLPRSEEEKRQVMELYERYGSMAYGIILRIVPQPELAQAVLVELFATLSVELELNKTEHVSALIIRTARRKALASRLGSAERSLTSFQPTERNLPKVVFNLAFWHGCHVTEIADRLNIATTDVLRAIRAYVKSFTVA